MPRTGRGGRRQPTPGKKYANRTDLAQGPSVPNGMQYGERKTLEMAAQGRIPDAPPAPPAATSMPGAGGGGAPAGGNPLDGFQFSRPVTGLREPSARPGEPLLTGLGGDPAAAFQGPPPPHVRALALLNSLGDKVSPQVRALREVLNAQQLGGGM